MRVVLELTIDETVPVDYLQEMAEKAMRAIRLDSGPNVHPRLLVELGPNYLEIPIQRPPRSKADPVG